MICQKCECKGLRKALLLIKSWNNAPEELFYFLKKSGVV